MQRKTPFRVGSVCLVSMRARIAPAGVRLGGQKGVFSGRGGGGCEKSFRGAPGGYRTDF